MEIQETIDFVDVFGNWLDYSKHFELERLEAQYILLVVLNIKVILLFKLSL